MPSSILYPPSSIFYPLNYGGLCVSQELVVQPCRMLQRRPVILFRRHVERRGAPRWLHGRLGGGEALDDLRVRLERAVGSHQAEEALVARFIARRPAP